MYFQLVPTLRTELKISPGLIGILLIKSMDHVEFTVVYDNHCVILRDINLRRIPNFHIVELPVINTVPCNTGSKTVAR